MEFLPRTPVLMLARRLMPRPHESRIPIAAPAAPAARRSKLLARLGEIEKLLARIRVENHRAHGNFQNRVFARASVAIGSFAVPPALGAKFAVVAVAQQRVVVRIRFDHDVAAVAAVAARWPASRDVLLPAKRDAAIAAVAALHQDFGFINKHKSPVSKVYTKEAYVANEGQADASAAKNLGRNAVLRLRAKTSQYQ